MKSLPCSQSIQILWNSLLFWCGAIFCCIQTSG